MGNELRERGFSGTVVISKHFSVGNEENNEYLEDITADGLIEIKTSHLPNARLQFYRHNNTSGLLTLFGCPERAMQMVTMLACTVRR